MELEEGKVGRATVGSPKDAKAQRGEGPRMDAEERKCNCNLPYN